MFSRNNNHQVSTDYLKWREMVLNRQPAAPMRGLTTEVYGMLMDIGMGDGRDKFLGISIYAFETGEASLKASTGMGVMGLGDMPILAGVSQRIIERGQALVQLARPTASMAYPEANQARFYFLTSSGVRVYDSGLNSLRPGHIFFEVFSLFSQVKSVADRCLDEAHRKKNPV